MTTFPNSPRLQKGAIVGLDPANPLASVIWLTQQEQTHWTGRQGELLTGFSRLLRGMAH